MTTQQRKRELVEDWQAVRLKADTQDWAKQIVAHQRPDTDSWIAHYHDDAARVSGWGHNYFCKSCTSSLIFDKTKPTEHVCSKCGMVNDSQEICEAWNASYRSLACKKVFESAIWYNLYGDDKYLTYINQVLDFLSDNLDSFTISTPAGFEGIFSGINLSDAVCVAHLLSGMELVRDQFTAEQLARYKEKFFIPTARFLCTVRGGTPNISCWMRGSAGMIGLFFNEPEWCQEAENGFEGIREVLSEGLLTGGFWYESSFHYHLYCAEGLHYYAAFCELYGHDFPELRQAMLEMYKYPVHYVFPNGLFPSPNDGWPFRSFRTYAQQYEWIRNIYDEPAFRFALSQVYDERVAEPDKHLQDVVSSVTGGVYRLLFGQDWTNIWQSQPEAVRQAGEPARISRHDEHIYYAMLQDADNSVFFKYGFVLRGHSHADVMNFEWFTGGQLVSRDISNSGYGTDLFRDWQRRSIAHNTVMINALTQPNRPRGQLEHFDEASNHVIAAADNVYPGVRYKRDLQLVDGRLADTFSIEACADDTQTLPIDQPATFPQAAFEGVETIDWLFHCSGELQHDLPFVPTAAPADSEGYQLMQDVASVQIDGDWRLQWKLDDQTIELNMAGHPGTTVYIFRGYEHRQDLLRWGVMVRRTEPTTVFHATYSSHSHR